MISTLRISVFFLLIFLALCVPPIFLNIQPIGGLASDSVVYHLPQINEFIEQPLDIIDYTATVATLPGYHALLGWLAAQLGITTVDNGTLAVRFAHLALSSVGLIIYMYTISRFSNTYSSIIIVSR